MWEKGIKNKNEVFYEKGNKAKAVFGSNHGSTLGLWKCWERNQKQEQQVLRVGIDSELSTADVSLAMDNTAVDVMSQVGRDFSPLTKKEKRNQHWQLKSTALQ